MFKNWCVPVGYLAIFICATRWLGTASLAQLVLFGVVPVLWLDRWFFKLVPWTSNEPLRWELARRAAWFLGGLLAFRQFWMGNVPWLEALFLGAEITLAAAFLESLVRAGAATRRWAVGKSPTAITWAGRWREAAVVIGLVVLLAPLGALHPPHSVAKRLPAVPGIAVETVNVPTADGLELHGWLMTQKDARAMLVYCHGHKGNCGQVAKFIKAVQPLGFNVLACDFRGHGASPGHTAAFGLHETEDVIAAARFIRARYPNKPLFLVGVSYGAAVALQALPEIPDVRAVWVEGAFASFDGVVDRFFQPVPEPLRGCVTGFYGALGWIDCGLRPGEISPMDRLHGVRVPICFCHGRLDNLIPFAQTEAMYCSYAGPKSCLWFDDAGHYRLRTNHEAEYFTRFCSFLNEWLEKELPVASSSKVVFAQ
jgi:pimeloyl-ACP methyl ester carboxylesterase